MGNPWEELARGHKVFKAVTATNNALTASKDPETVIEEILRNNHKSDVAQTVATSAGIKPFSETSWEMFKQGLTTRHTTAGAPEADPFAGL